MVPSRPRCVLGGAHREETKLSAASRQGSCVPVLRPVASSGLRAQNACRSEKANMSASCQTFQLRAGRRCVPVLQRFAPLTLALQANIASFVAGPREHSPDAYQASRRRIERAPAAQTRDRSRSICTARGAHKGARESAKRRTPRAEMSHTRYVLSPRPDRRLRCFCFCCAKWHAWHVATDTNRRPRGESAKRGRA